MNQQQKLLIKILLGNSDSNIRFNEICNLLKSLGFEVRINGSHHIFRMEGIAKKLNLQKDGDKAKSYQIKQVRNLILENNLGDLTDE
jgi:predicted RNA binding protein YcfA (HicA-like mRNA interferase family)